MTTYVYKSTTGFPVNIDNYIITPNPGLESKYQIENLDNYLGSTISRYDDGVLATVDDSFNVKATKSSTGVVALRAGSNTLPMVTVLSQSGVPIGIPGSGTVGANGALTLTTGLPLTYSAGGGIYLYFPAGACYSASAAGFYYCVMTSSTAGTIYNNIYSPGTNFPIVPSLPTTYVAAGPGAYTGSTAAITAVQATVPGGILGANGRLAFGYLGTNVNSAGNKTYTIYVGGNLMHTINATTTVSMAVPEVSVANRGATNRQISVQTTIAGTSGALPAVASVDTSVDFNVEIRLQHSSSATDAIVLEHNFIQALPRD